MVTTAQLVASSKPRIRVVNFGGGVNSTGALVEAERRGVRPDIIVFADTGNEMPHTYEHLEEMQRWCRAVGFPEIDIVRWVRKQDTDVGKAGEFVTIEEACLRGNPPSLPSKAYGFSGCTSKWKQQPADDFVTDHPLVRAEHLAGRPVERWIGYDADEPQRYERMVSKWRDQLMSDKPAERKKALKWVWRAPLIEWGMGRDECEEAIRNTLAVDVDENGVVLRDRAMDVPRKSACFFCPSSKKKDILWLRDTYPDLLERALAIEDAARPHLENVKGLGRSSFAWRDFLASEEAKTAVEGRVCLPVLPDVVSDTSCGCYDGADE